MDELQDLADELGADIEIIELDEPIEELDGDDEDIVPTVSEFNEEDDENIGEPVDSSQRTFTKHLKSVFQGVLNAAGTIAATGGEDDIAYVWSTETLEVLFECTGHKDSVTQVAFNFDEQLLATGDMGGLLQVWNVAERRLIWCYEGDDLEWLMWHPKANVLFAGCEFGSVFVWQVPQGNCKVLASRGSTSTCGQILSDGIRLLVGYGDGQVRLWDIKTESVLWELQKDVPVNITSLDISKDDGLFIVAPSAQIFKVSDGTLVTTLVSTNEVDVEAVAFNQDSGLIATGALLGTACIWDVRTNTIRQEANVGASITIIKWGPNDTVIFGSANGCIYVVDAKTGILIETLTGHKLDILSITLSKSGDFILSTSDDATAKIFTIANSI